MGETAFARASYSETKSTITTRLGNSGPGTHCASALSVTLPEGGEKRPDPTPAPPFSRHVLGESCVT